MYTLYVYMYVCMYACCECVGFMFRYPWPLWCMTGMDHLSGMTFWAWPSSTYFLWVVWLYNDHVAMITWWSCDCLVIRWWNHVTYCLVITWQCGVITWLPHTQDQPEVLHQKLELEIDGSTKREERSLGTITVSVIFRPVSSVARAGRSLRI